MMLDTCLQSGATLMHYAVRVASSQIIKTLLLHNVDINLQDNVWAVIPACHDLFVMSWNVNRKCPYIYCVGWMDSIASCSSSAKNRCCEAPLNERGRQDTEEQGKLVTFLVVSYYQYILYASLATFLSSLICSLIKGWLCAGTRSFFGSRNW